MMRNKYPYYRCLKGLVDPFLEVETVTKVFAIINLKRMARK